MEKTRANLHTQSNKPRKRHRARAKKNPTKIRTNHTDNLVPLSPNIIWTLIPAVAATLKNAIFTFRPIKKPRLTHKASHANVITFPFLLCKPTTKVCARGFIPF
jgi:hypothetical protein